MKAGLTPTETVAPNANQMAEALLNIGLENNSRAFLISCIKVLLSFDLLRLCLATRLNTNFFYIFQDEGANLNFVEKWAWQQVVNLKLLREKLCHILFDHSTQEMEHQVMTLKPVELFLVSIISNSMV